MDLHLLFSNVLVCPTVARCYAYKDIAQSCFDSHLSRANKQLIYVIASALRHIVSFQLFILSFFLFFPSISSRS